jgi:hypothetical protein
VLKLSFTTVLLRNADIKLLMAVACSVAKKESTKYMYVTLTKWDQLQEAWWADVWVS